ncbi:Arb2 domain-containing protein [Aspergillus avenaceus]|uniref:Arb2 domain-containing protein n=1 Tax=Aspergillus avenaceus TaxID=36643 RepID=A0A5N6TMK5_ASPAV|nr:Arb2 domain-containing protein [Aspergillus avenaceus]
MYVFERGNLPADAHFPADLGKLGYFINDKDQIRKISDPTQDFRFKINSNARWNELQREAMNECIRTIVSSRLRDLGLTTLRLPLKASSVEPHVPVMVSSNLSSATRIIVVIGEPIQDLGVWAYRSVGEDSIDGGTAVSLAKAIFRPGTDKEGDTDPKGKREETALILANTGQLIWHCGARKAMTLTSWTSFPRPSAVDPPLMMTGRNKVPKNESWEEHIMCVFDEILASRGHLVRKDAKVDVIGVADGGLGVIRYLSDNWEDWRPYISAICLTNPLHSVRVDLSNEGDDKSSPSSFAAFLSSRCRAYVLSDQEDGLPVSGSVEYGCNCYASGESLNIEGIMSKAWVHMLEWLDRAHADPNLFEAQLEVKEFGGEAWVSDSE